MTPRSAGLRALLPCATLVVCFALGCGQEPPGDDGVARGAPALAEDWPQHGRTAAEERHTPLDQINRETVSRLGLAWSYGLDLVWSRSFCFAKCHRSRRAGTRQCPHNTHIEPGNYPNLQQSALANTP